MPALSPTMEQGNIASWAKKVGDRVNEGDVIAEVETDKATVAFESIEEGYLAKICVEEGSENVAVGTLVAILAEEEADVAAFANYVDPEAGAGAIPASSAPAAATPVAAAAPAAAAAPTATAAAPSGGRVVASPRARRVARERGIDISQVKGSGPGHRIKAVDVENFKGAPAAAPAAHASAAAAAPVAPAAEGDFVDVPLTNMRKVIASRLLESKQTMPHYYLSMDCQMDALLAARAKLNAGRDKASRLSVNDFVVKASACAMKEVPELNASWMGNAIRSFNYVDVCVAVSTPTGLITPIVKDCDVKGLDAISADTKDLATRARENKLDPSEYQGGTFTISNLGMFGVSSFTAVINPPQAAILAVGTTVKRVVPNPKPTEDAPFLTASYMTVTLSCDHRVVDGAVGSKWLSAFKKCIEDPMAMLL